MKLNPFQQWCVRQNVERAKTEGVTVVCARLRANGYPSIADAVEEATS